MTEPLYAAVDCGTNSTRLLISDGRSQIERHMRVTRLGAGVDRTGRLDPEAIERRVEASDTCAARLLAAGVDARHLFEDHASGAKDDRAGLARALEFVRPGDVLVVWKLDRLGRSLSHLLAIVTSLKKKQVAFRSLTENLDTTTPSGEFLFQVFGALAQYERALIQERVVAGLAAARKRGRIGGRPQAITGEKLEAIVAALDGGMSKAAVCRNFGVKRTTLIETLARVGWTGSRGASSR